MTRVLAELLGAEQPQFSATLQQLERAAGRPNFDILLTTEINQRLSAKISELGLDPNDTTATELYRALIERFGSDELLARQALQLQPDAQVLDVLVSIQQFVSKNIKSEKSFALKASVAKKLLKKVPPKKAMKQLNYRSVDSMLKHEPVAFIYTAALLAEPSTWRKKYFDQYINLSPSDFEVRDVEVIVPTTERWINLSTSSTNTYKNNVIAFKELGTVVILPIEKDMVGLALTNLLLVLHACNEVISTGSYMKLLQVRPDFGKTLRSVAENELDTNVILADRPVPWRVIHQYYARFKDAYNPNIFEPHVQPTDLSWRAPEAILAKLHPRLSFWQDTAYTSTLMNKSIVSLNLLDVAINYCNNLPFADRVSNFARQDLWHELMVRYLNRENVELALGNKLQPEYIRIDP